MKNTSVTPSATLDQMPSPSHKVKIGASTTRGSALTILTKGSNTAATRGWRANQKPTRTPPSEPIVKPRIDSHNVIRRCFQITPLENQSRIWLPTSTGLEKKNGGSSRRPNIGTVANNCHSPSATTATSSCKERSPIFDTPAVSPYGLNVIPAKPATASGRRRLRVTLHHLILQHAPDFAMQRVKLMLQSNFGDVTRTRHRPPPVADDPRAWSRRHDHHAIG